MKKLVDQVSGVLALVQTSLEIARSEENAAEKVLTLRENLQTLRERLLAVREQVTTLQSEKVELEERLAQRARFERERREFFQRKLDAGSVVYVRHEPVEGGGEAPIHYCAYCFDRGEQVKLQLQEQKPGSDPHKCPACGSPALIPHDRPVPRPVQRRFGRRGRYGLA